MSKVYKANIWERESCGTIGSSLVVLGLPDLLRVFPEVITTMDNKGMYSNSLNCWLSQHFFEGMNLKF